MTPRNSRGSRSRSSSSSSSSRAGSKAGASGASKQKQSRQRTGSSSGRGASRAAASSLALEGRSRVILVLFGILALLFFGRLFFLQVIVSDQYTAQAQETRTVNIPTTPRRGTIYDRNGIVLAISVDATTIYANPKEIENPDHTAMVLAEVLGGQVSDYRTMITRPNTTFSYVKRQADVEEADRLREEKLPGIYFIDDSRREYPNGSIGGQIVGCTDWDGNGLTGLELQYDDILKGTAGTYSAEWGNPAKSKGALPIPGAVREETPAVDGQDIMVSVDIKLQNSVEQALAQGVEDLGTDEGSAVLMDAKTGEIYAICSLPYMDPGNMNDAKAGSDQVKAITQPFEPGSIFKTVSALTVLESKAMTPESELFCPSTLEADGYTISDSHERDAAVYSLRQILDHSSNIGISLAVEQSTGFRPLYDNIVAWNLNDRTGVDYPGEASGSLQPYENWATITGYNVSFGQGISVTPLQMVRFYGALINDGYEVTPHFLLSKPQTGETYETESVQVIEDKQALEDVRSMLRTVVADGTGTAAAIDGFTVAGKTSTAEIADQGVYKKGIYNLCFTGYLDNSSSSLVCFVGANEVEGMRQTTKIFNDIMTTAIDQYNITPNEEA